jgi:succinoglycan biosynthesis transport protein ExoP
MVMVSVGLRGMVPASSGEGELDLRSIGRALWRKKFRILLPTLLVLVLTSVAVNLMVPRYKSEARILIEGRENVFLRPEAEKLGDRERSVVDQEAVTSQVQLVLSREVARQVVAQLKLNERPEFDPVLRPSGPLKQVLTLLGITRDSLRLTPEERVFESYYDRVQAYSVDKSRVIAIEFQSSDPELAARGANAVAEIYLGLQQNAKQDQTRAAGQWLAGEIENLRARVADAESKAEEFRTKSNLFIGSNNSSLANQQLGELSSQLAVARSQKAEIDAKENLIRQMLRTNNPIESAEILNSEIIRRLNEQRVTLRAQLAEQSSTLLDGHPRIKELKAQIADLERQIRAEAERLVRSLENDAKIAGGRVEQLGSSVDALKRQASSSSGQDVQLRAYEREAKAQRDLLESYLAKYREATARENLGATPAEARIISRAIVSNTPFFPKKLPIVTIATLAMLVLATGFVVTGELASGNVYRQPPWAEPTIYAEHPAAPAARLVPQIEQAPASVLLQPEAAPARSVAIDETVHSLAEAAHKLNAADRTRSLVVSVSADPQATAIDLGRELAAHGRVIVVDLAFGARKVSQSVGDTAAPGIAELVRGEKSFGEVIVRDRGSRVHVIGCGDIRDEGASIAQSERLVTGLNALARSYAHVVIDAGAIGEIPPKSLAKIAPRAIVVMRPGETVGDACQVLEEAGFTASMLTLVRPREEPAAAA